MLDCTAPLRGLTLDPARRRAVVAVLALVAGVVTAVVGVSSTRWIDTTFPGFFVIVNRVVPSIALPWSDADPSALFQHQVVAVDGVPVHSAADVYRRVARLTPGTPVRYLLRAPDGTRVEAVVPARSFARSDWLLLFGVFLVTGVAFAATGLFVFLVTPGSPAGSGLLAACLTIGLFVITAVDLYGPHTFTRAHITLECLGGAALLHLAVVFPTVRVAARRRRRIVLACIYLPFVALAAAYQWALGDPGAYTRVHLQAVALHVVALLAITSVVLFDRIATRSPLVRRRIGVVALGTSTAFGLPLVVMAGSSLLGGRLPINAAAFTAPLFPLSLGYAVAATDLFEIDAVLRRAATYAVVVIAMAGIYFALLLGLERVLPEQVAASPTLFACVDLGLLFLVAPIHARAQRTVDRVFFRTDYDAEESLGVFSRRLVSAHTADEVAAETVRILGETLHPEPAQLLARGAVALPPRLAERLDGGRALARYAWEDGSGRTVPAAFTALRADVLVPVVQDEGVAAVLALGPRGSGRPYRSLDLTFLQRVAGHVALALANARAFERLEALNATLEAQVAERTAALADANADLGRSLGELRAAYAQLERSQASLVRADRLATLGRLTAGLAHEVNTPLAAVMNALRLLHDLAAEYDSSIDDPAVEPKDHHEIAGEMLTLVAQTASYAEKAAAFIARAKMHGRELRPAVHRPFAVASVVEEARVLLAHRLRASGCTLEWHEAPPGIELRGDPARLGQVVVNLLSNALDAYEDCGRRGAVVVTATQVDDLVHVTVRDRAGGMAPEVAERAFEELFTTKEPGRGTGLGLWIARNLVEEAFQGTLSFETRAGEGTCFAIAVPATAADVPAVAAATAADDVAAAATA